MIERSRIVLACCAVAAAAAYLGLFGNVPLSQPDEARYAEIPREMIERAEFVTPTLNYVEYLEKPPLHYWLTAAAFTLLGENERTARLWPGLMAFGTVVATGLVGRRLWGAPAGRAAALVLGATPFWLVAGRINTIDPVFSALLALCLMAFLAFDGAPSRGGGRAWLVAFYGLSALATLTKGPIGVLFPAAIIGSYLILTRRPGRVGEMRIAWGILLVLLLTVPWFVLASLRNPDFAWFFFVHEHYLRFTTTTHAHEHPFWYFGLLVALGTLPFTGYLAAGVAAPLRRWWQRRAAEPNPELFLVLWAGIVLVFFSASSSKLPFYILPVFPALALLAGRRVAELEERAGAGLPWSHRGCIGALAVLGMLLAATPFVLPALRDLRSVEPGVEATLAGLGAGTLALLAPRLGQRWDCGPLPWVSLGTLLLTLGALHVGIQLDSELRRGAPMWATVEQALEPDDVLVEIDGYHPALSFYLRRRVVLVSFHGELAFGSGRAPDRDEWFWNHMRFLAEWRSGRPMWVVMHAERFDRKQLDETGRLLSEELGEYTEVARHEPLILFTNRTNLAGEDASGG